MPGDIAPETISGYWSICCRSIVIDAVWVASQSRLKIQKAHLEKQSFTAVIVARHEGPWAR
jgi:hypothetical protein